MVFNKLLFYLKKKNFKKIILNCTTCLQLKNNRFHSKQGYNMKIIEKNR